MDPISGENLHPPQVEVYSIQKLTRRMKHIAGKQGTGMCTRTTTYFEFASDVLILYGWPYYTHQPHMQMQNSLLAP